MRGSAILPDYQRFYIRIKGIKKGEKRVYLEVSGKDPETGEIKLLPPPENDITSISGKLVKIENSHYEYEGDTINTVIIFLADEENKEYYKIESGRNSLMRSIVNSLASAEDLNQSVVIRVYNAKETGRARVWVGIYDKAEDDFVSLNWKLSFDDIKAMTGVIEKTNKAGKVIDTEYDYSEVDEEIFGKILPAIKTGKISASGEGARPASLPKEEDDIALPGDKGPDLPEEEPQSDVSIPEIPPTNKKRRVTRKRAAKVVAPAQDPIDDRFEDDLPF
jgi:hypothetical protein